METQIEVTEANKPVELILSDLYEKYKDNQYMLNRLQTYLTNLPSMLDSENKKYEERLSRINELTMEQDNFYKVFLMKHQYFYMPYNNIYYDYDGKIYKIIKDDDIHHHLLSTITDEGKLMPWKHKTKQNIIKQIKEAPSYIVAKLVAEEHLLGLFDEIEAIPNKDEFLVDIQRDIRSAHTNEGQLMKAIEKIEWYESWGNTHLIAYHRALVCKQCIKRNI